MIELHGLRGGGQPRNFLISSKTFLIDFDPMELNWPKEEQLCHMTLV